MTVQDLVLHNEITEDGDRFSITVYFDKADDAAAADR